MTAVVVVSRGLVLQMRSCSETIQPRNVMWESGVPTVVRIGLCSRSKRGHSFMKRY